MSKRRSRVKRERTKKKGRKFSEEKTKVFFFFAPLTTTTVTRHLGSFLFGTIFIPERTLGHFSGFYFQFSAVCGLRGAVCFFGEFSGLFFVLYFAKKTCQKCISL